MMFEFYACRRSGSPASDHTLYCAAVCFRRSATRFSSLASRADCAADFWFSSAMRAMTSVCFATSTSAVFCSEIAPEMSQKWDDDAPTEGGICTSDTGKRSWLSFKQVTRNTSPI